MKKRIPIGIDDFKEARQNCYFVDKSGFIGEFLRQRASVTLITRPRRFGKTMTLSMLRYFLDIEHAEENRALFDGLAVSKNVEVMEEQGKRPVVALTLKGWKFPSLEAMRSGVPRKLAELFRAYSYLLKGDLAGWDKEDFEALVRTKADMALCQDSLAFLMRLMESYYGAKPVLLLDEYDVPIQSAWEHGYYNEAIGFYREFLSAALKSNPSLDFAVLTGVLRISKESIFSDLNNLQVDSILDSRFPTAIGFTESEVQKMAADLGHEDKMVEIKAWYDGYDFQGNEIYNPWSVLNYFSNHCKPHAYWVNSSGNSILQEMLVHAKRPVFDGLSGLLQGKPVQAVVREGFIYRDIYRNKNALYTMLLTTGYLTTKGLEDKGYGTQAELVIPNREILSLFRTEVLERYENDELDISIPNLMQAFLAGDSDTVQEGLSEYLELLTSNFDAAKGKEAFYHGFVLGMTAVLTEDYVIRSNRESGYGRYDVAVMPKSKKNPGMLFEFKTAEDEASMESRAEEALAQIQQNDYAAELRREDVDIIRYYGIAFCGKKVFVAMQ